MYVHHSLSCYLIPTNKFIRNMKHRYEDLIKCHVLDLKLNCVIISILHILIYKLNSILINGSFLFLPFFFEPEHNSNV